MEACRTWAWESRFKNVQDMYEKHTQTLNPSPNRKRLSSQRNRASPAQKPNLIRARASGSLGLIRGRRGFWAFDSSDMALQGSFCRAVIPACDSCLRAAEPTSSNRGSSWHWAPRTLKPRVKYLDSQCPESRCATQVDYGAGNPPHEMCPAVWPSGLYPAP